MSKIYSRTWIVLRNPHRENLMVKEHITNWLEKGGRPNGRPSSVPDITERDAWTGLPEEIRTRLIANGESRLGFSWPMLPATSWLAFTRSGNRVDFESLYFSRRKALCALVAAECAEDSGRFLDDIINGVYAICEETGWQLPAHNSYERDKPSHPLPIAERPVLDLFACETGALLAMTRHLLRVRLDLASPIVCERILAELGRRIVQPYLQEHFWWMGNGDEPMCNWTPWCTQNVLTVFLFSPQPEASRREALLKAAGSLDCFLKDYGADGCCDEGAQYYRHAALCMFTALELMDEAMDGVMAPIWQQEKVRHMAAYILNVHVADRHYINFADCSPIAGRCGVREFLYGGRVQNQDLMDFAALDAVRGGLDVLAEEINLYHLIQTSLAWRDLTTHLSEAQRRSFLLGKPIPAHPEQVWYPSVGLFIARDDHWCLAAKAGDNADNHNHNDTGSITLYRDGKPFLIDAGVESYTRRTFSKDRYEIWTMQSSWHNLPEFDGVMQRDGADFQATDVEVCFSPEESVISMDLTRAWPKEAGLSRYVRTASLSNGRVVVKDHAEGTFRESVMNLLFSTCPSLVDGMEPTPHSVPLSIPGAQNGSSGIVLRQAVLSVNGLGNIRICGSNGIHIEERPVTDARLATAWTGSLWRVRIAFTGRLRMEMIGIGQDFLSFTDPM